MKDQQPEFDGGRTMRFSIKDASQSEMKKILIEVYDALVEKGGYDPINQIVGYILSEDPGYITNYKNARTLIRKIDRDELLQALIKNYLEN
ncbi:MAG: IreB family regulatory phosphoprotein [Clostridiales bacterium]|nr:MAG: IreB family regulatory phosphoprotein [Clostridiales bacterium]